MKIKCYYYKKKCVDKNGNYFFFVIKMKLQYLGSGYKCLGYSLFVNDLIFALKEAK